MTSRGYRLWAVITIFILSWSGPVAAAVNDKIAAVTAGSWHSLALGMDGTLWAWGDNHFGQLGQGQTADRLRPARVPGGSGWKAIVAGEDFTLGLKTDGTLWAWGTNGYGQLGLGFADADSHPTPTQVGADTWKAVAAGVYHALAIRADGTLWTWGYNYYGQLGLADEDTIDRWAPTQVGTFSDWTAVAGGTYHSLGLRGGTLWGWGDNRFGQLGMGPGDTDERYIPDQVGKARDWTVIAAGEFHSLGIRSGTLWAWGDNYFGELGLGASIGQQEYPGQVGSATDWTAISAGFTHSLGLRGGSLYAWGWDFFGQLGLGNNASIYQYIPAQVGQSSNWAAVAARADRSLALGGDGSLWAWGLNDYGELGLGDTTDRHSPVQVKFTSPTLPGLILLLDE